MATQEGSRKRIKISRSEGRETPTALTSRKHPHPEDNNNTVLGMDNNINSNQAAASAAAKDSITTCCTHERSLKTLQSDLDTMRQLVSCKICDRLLYEPYSLSCGHTYCYSCLTQWLGSTPRKTCPDCRCVISEQPTPSYIIRELVVVFIARTELLPDGETAEEHAKLAREESETVAKDKANTDPRSGGLFGGCFKRRPRRRPLIPLHDPGDGVDRCPQCHWEVEDGFCGQCGVHVDGREHLGFSDYDDSEDSDYDLDHELDLEDAEAVFGPVIGDERFDAYVGGVDGYMGDYDNDDRDRDPLRHLDPEIQRYWAREGGPAVSLISDDEDEEDEDEDDDDGLDRDLEGFVVEDDSIEEVSSDDEDGDGNGSDHTETQTRSRYRSRGVPTALSISSDNEDDNDEGDGQRQRNGHATPSGGPWSALESEQDSEDEGPIFRGSQRAARPQMAMRQRRIVLSDDDDDEEEEDDDGEEVEEDGSDDHSTGYGTGSNNRPGRDFSRPAPYNYDHYGSDEEQTETEQESPMRYDAGRPLMDDTATDYDEDDDDDERESESESGYSGVGAHLHFGDEDDENDDEASEVYGASESMSPHPVHGMMNDDETPSPRHRSIQRSQSQRLQTLGHHSRRHATMEHRSSQQQQQSPSSSSSSAATLPPNRRQLAGMRSLQSPGVSRQGARLSSRSLQRPTATNTAAAVASLGTDALPPNRQRLSAHPFQLDNTLASINANRRVHGSA